MTRRKPLTLNAGKLEQLPDSGTIAGVASVRQTVLSGSVDSSSFPNALSIGSGLSVTLTASTGTPFLVSFAAGFDSNGAIDYLGQFTTNQSFTGLTANTTCFLYVDRNTTTGALTTGFSTLAPAYATVAPTSPAVDQHWFNLSTFQMMRWSGGAWAPFQRVFAGEAVTGATAVTIIATYAYRGRYQSAWIAVVASTNYSFNHDLGISLPAANVNVGIYTSIAGSDIDALIAVPSLLFNNQYYGYQVRSPSITVRRNIQIATQNFVALDYSNNWVTTAFYKLAVARGW